MSRSATGRPRRRGFVLLTGALVSIGLFAFLGLGFDVGYLQWTRQRIQAAADAAALGAQRELEHGSSNSTAIQAGNDDAALNGFTNGVNNTTVTVNVPPTSGNYSGLSGDVEVLVSQQVPVFFLRLVGPASAALSARAVAIPGASGCIYVLNPTAAQAFYMNGSYNVTTACGALVNSNNSQSTYFNGSWNWTGPLAMVGNYYFNGAYNFGPDSPLTGIGTITDPLSYLQPPSIGACNFTNYNKGGAYNVTVNPGVYCGGMRFSGAGNVTFNPGTYIFTGSTGLQTNGSVNMSGSGVTFYNTGTGNVNLSGASNVNLSAPTSGSLAGILFYQDPSDTAAAVVNGSSNGNFVGTLYFPNATLSYNGSSNNQYTVLVANILKFTGSVNVNNNYASLPGGSPVHDLATLAE